VRDGGGGQVVEAVNFNAPSQVVIAGHKAAVERACAAARQLGAKRALVLPVSAPFHSSLLQPAAERLRAYLANVEIKTPAIPLVNNVDVAIETEPARIADALARQAAGPVRWVEIVRLLVSQGVTHVVECGPGRVLAGSRDASRRSSKVSRSSIPRVSRKRWRPPLPEEADR